MSELSLTDDDIINSLVTRAEQVTRNLDAAESSIRPVPGDDEHRYRERVNRLLSRTDIESIEESAEWIRIGNLPALVDQAVQDITRSIERLRTYERDNVEPLADEKLEKDRLEFLDRCHKSKQKVLRATIYLQKCFDLKDGKSLKSIAKIFGPFYHQLGNVSQDVATSLITRLSKAKRRKELGEAWDDKIRETEHKAAEADELNQKLEREQKKLKALQELVTANLRQRATGSKEYGTQDIANMTNVSPQAVRKRLQWLSDRGRITAKPDPLGNWRLSLTELSIAVNFIKTKGL